MNPMLTITEGNDQFYPTPDYIAGKMLAGIDWDCVETILEPSAGKGDLLRCAVKARFKNRNRGGSISADCIEIDPYLRQILSYNFSKEAMREALDAYYELDRMAYSSWTEAEENEHTKLRYQLDEFKSVDMRIVHDDFLTYRGNKRYSLILMNPPFAQGDLHLLKALELQKRGGSIVCLLNAETIKNPYTNTRKLLMQSLDKYQAQITFVEDAFSKAERKADVDVAIVRVVIPYERSRSTIYERMVKAEEQQYSNFEATDLVAGSIPEQMVQGFNVECAAGVELIREFEAMQPYVMKELETPDNKAPYNSPILTLTVNVDSKYDYAPDINKYLRCTRLKYWRGLFRNEKVMGKLTSNIREEYTETVDKMADYDFTLFNIRQVLAEMDSKLTDGVHTTIMALFDKLSEEHSFYPESVKNVHYFNGWKTNKVHKVGAKSIIPTYGMFSTYSWGDNSFNVSNAYEIISDIEKVFDYLDGKRTADVDLLSRLNRAKEEGNMRNIECKYFKIDIYKKGTTHIKFTNMDLVDRLNIYAARKRNWLPPNYGKAAYSEMTEEEQAVVLDFQGEEAYSRVMANREYYLADPTQSVLMLTTGLSN